MVSHKWTVLSQLDFGESEGPGMVRCTSKGNLFAGGNIILEPLVSSFIQASVRWLLYVAFHYFRGERVLCVYHAWKGYLMAFTGKDALRCKGNIAC